MIKVSAGVIINAEGQVLLCSRPPDKPPAGWEFPGGKIEPGETPAEALERELLEAKKYKPQKKGGIAK